MKYITLDGLSTFATGLASKISAKFAKKTDIPTSLPANGGNAATVGGKKVETDVPAGAKFTDTVYTHPTSAGNKHIPSGGASGQILKWSADGTAIWGGETNTTYSPMKGATTSAAGTQGLVPAPVAGAQGKYLRGDGTWATVETGSVVEEASGTDIDNIINGLFK